MSEIKITITIRTNPKWSPMRFALGTLSPVIVIGTGAVLDSAAMQWLGFLIVLLVFVGTVIITANRDEDLSISEARERLDEIEREQSD